MGDFDTHDVLEQLIDPPYGMLAIQGVAEVMGDLLKRAWLIKVEDGGSKAKFEFLSRVPRLIELCRAISDRTDDSGRWVEKNDAVRQFKTQHPIYACLNELSEKGRLSEGRLHLLAHALVAAQNGLSGTSDSTKMPPANIQAAFRELRRLDSRVLDSVLFELPSRHACYQRLREVEQLEVSEFGRAELEQLGHIRRLIGLSLGVEKPLVVASRTKVGGVSGTQVDGQISKKEISPEQLGDDEGENFYLVEASVSEPSDIDSGRLDGLAPRDVAPEIRQAVPTGRANSRRGGSQQQSVYQGRHIRNQMRRSVQPLTGRWDRLTEFDVASSISALSWRGAGQNAGTIAVGLVLLIGRPLSTVLNARLYGYASQVPKHVSNDSIAICHEDAFIQVYVPVPERARPLNLGWQGSLLQGDNQLRLPIVRLLWDLLVDAIGESKSGWHGYLFPRSDASDIKKSAKQIISELRLEDTARVTDTRLQRCLFNEIADVQGDTVDAVFITGCEPSTGTHVGLHYYCVAEADLQARYLTALCGMVPDDLQRLMMPIARCSTRDHYIGSPLCPKLERLSALVMDLREKLIAARISRLEADNLIEIHNSYTAYVVMFMAVATGYRSVQAPLSRRTDYDPVSGMLVVADKTNSAFSHARLVPVPEVLARQLDLYRQHRDRVGVRMWAILGIEEPRHFLFFLSNARKARQSQKLIRAIPVSDETLKANLTSIWDLPLNTNRHFLRSELRHRNVHAELVDAWMGHWLDGQEPMGRYSTLSPIDFASGIEPVLSEILDEMGWTPEEGLP